MDDWITNYYDVPESGGCVSVKFLAQDYSNSAAEHQKPSIKGGNATYPRESSSVDANFNRDFYLAAA